MIRLQLLGSQQLERDAGEALDSVVAQPKRFALLAYLALAAPTFVRRDTVLTLLWPELDQFAARRALRNTIYQLRRVIGSDVFRNRGDEEISLDSGAVWCDAVALATAVEDERFDDAVALYRGEFLQGFQLPGSEDEFTSWLMTERDNAQRRVLRALDALVVREIAAGHASAAARWAMRAHEITPHDELWLQRAMTLLVASGDRGAATHLYRAFTRRLRDETGGEPTAVSARLAERIAAEGPTAPVPVAAAPGSPAGAPQSNLPHRSRTRQRMLAAVGTVLVGGALLGIVTSRRARTHADPHRVLVTILQNRTGDPRLETLGDMAADWVSRGLFATGLGEIIDPSVVAVRGRTAAGQPTDPLRLARTTGAGTVVEGYYYKSGDSLLFAVSIADANSGHITGQVGPVGGPIARPAAALDDLRSRVMTGLSMALDPRFAEHAQRGIQPPPFPAYDAYVRASDAFWLSDYRQTESLLRQAVRLDTTFAQAAVGLATLGSNAGECALTDSINRSWPPERGRLTEADRLTLAIAVAHCHGQVDDMLRLSVVRAHLLPRSSSALLMSAGAALWADRPAETLTILHGVNPDIDLAWMPDSAHAAFFEAIAEADHRLGRYDDELAAGRRLGPSAALERAQIRARASLALHRRRDALDALDSALAAPAEPESYWGLLPATEGRPQLSATAGWTAAWIAREFFAHGDSITGRAVAARTLAWVDRRSAYERSTPEVRFLEATMRDLAGDYAGERRVLRTLLADDSTNIDTRGLMAGADAGAGDTAAAAAGDTWLAHLSESRAGWAATLYRARIAARERRTDDAIRYLRLARETGAWPIWVHCDPAVFPLLDRPDYRALIAPQK